MARRRGTKRKAVAQKYQGWLYSCISTGAPAAGTIAPFQNRQAFGFAEGAVIPGSAVVSDRTHTNMAVGSQLPDGVAMTVEAIGFRIKDSQLQTDPVDPINIYDNLVATVFYDARNRSRELGPLVLWPAGVGVTGNFVSDAAAAPLLRQGMTNGAPFGAAMRKLQTPIPLKGRRNFTVAIDAPHAIIGLVATTEVFIQVMLWGTIYDRVSPT